MRPIGVAKRWVVASEVATPLAPFGAAHPVASVQPVAALSAVEVAVACAMRDVLRLEVLPRAQDGFFETLGGSSLQFVLLLGRLEAEFEIQVAFDSAIVDASVQGLAARLQSVSGSTAVTYGAAVDDQSRQPGVALVAAYVGDIPRYQRLAAAMSGDRSVSVLLARVEPTVDHSDSIEQLASKVVSELRMSSPAPYILAGYSAGGLIAYEAARLLESCGDSVLGVVLIDSPRLASVAGYYWGELVLNLPQFLSSFSVRWWRARVSKLLGRRSRLYRRWFIRNETLEAVLKADRTSNDSVKRYRADGYAGRLLLVRSRHGAVMACGRPVLGWGKTRISKDDAVRVVGRHDTLLEMQNVAAVAAAVDRLLERLP